MDQVVTTRAKPQRQSSSVDVLNSREALDIQEIEIEQEMRALLSTSSPIKCQVTAGTPPHRIFLETSFTSLQSPSEFPQAARELSLDSTGLPWEFISLASELLHTPRPNESKL